MAIIDIGNYRYNTDGSVKVIDITLDYDPEEPIESTFEIDGMWFQVTNMSGCFYACSNLTIAPNIPETVTDMSGCFYGCSSLAQAPVIPSGVTDLSTCFYNCSSLTNLIKSEDTSVVQDKTYYVKDANDKWEVVETPDGNPSTSNYYELEMSIPNTVTDMSGCFYGCYNLIGAPEIPDSVISINSCFYRCYSLQTPPTIPNSVTDMAYCFASCIGLTTAPTIPEGITDLTFCFYNCSALTAAPVIPNSVTNLYSCFYDCASLATVSEIPASVTNMDYCFYNCANLTGVMKVRNNPSTYKDVFASNVSLEIVTIEPISVTSPVYNKWNTIITNYSEIIIDDYFDSSVIFNDGDYKYTSVIGEEDIDSYHQTEDGDDAQAELEYEVASGDVITVGYHASEDTTDYTVTFTNDGTTQTNGPITFDGGFNFIANGYYISWLEYNAINVPYYNVLVEVTDKNKTNYSSLQSGFLINDRKYSLTILNNCFKNCTALIQAPTIPNSVISMQNCFENCTSLVRVLNLSSSVVYMEDCFHNCSSLIQVPNIPTGVINLTCCFEGCSLLTQAPVISNTVIQMGGCFKSCTSITQAPVIPNSVTNLRGCFEGCTSLAQAPEIPNSVTDITSCFKRCSKLAQAPDIPSNVTNANNCFEQCTALTGNIKIATVAIFSSSNSFTGTVLPIYLINNTPTRAVIITENLQTIAAADPDDNLHFEAEDTIITASAIVQRVRELDSEIAGESTNAFIKAIVETNNMLPRGWTNTLAINSLQMDGAAIAPTWQSTSENLQSVYKTWYNTKDYKEHSFTLSVTGEVRDENKQRIKLINVNDIVFTLARAPGVPFSAYHDKETNTDGIAVGMLASRGNFLEVDWNAQFNQDVYLDLDLDTTTLDSKSDVIGDLFFELDVDAGASVDTDATSGANMELFNAIRQLGWYDSVITE